MDKPYLKRKRSESCHDMLILLGALVAGGICAMLLKMAEMMCVAGCR